ncbi:MAG: hypothetical protein DRJ03_30810 [Chloroflexi bacterium]|nr:MAG: hypothetical protein DRJ03_30810 [Chloroflexota bacterium]
MIDIKSQIIKPALGLEDMRVVASAEGWNLMDVQSLGFFNKRNFRYQRVITITERSGSNWTDYQVPIELNSTNFNFSHTRFDGGDIRFTDTAENLLPYWIESFDASAQTAKIFVKVPSLPANATIVIYMYYGNSSLSSLSDGNSVFEFFDDDFFSFQKTLENANTYQTTPTYDGSGQCVHPDIVFFPIGWHGYKYWMVMTPYPYGNDDYENPSILASNDGASWEVPSELTNPIDPEPANGHNADTDMIYNDETDELWVYYVEKTNETSYLKRKTSSDGINWNTEEDIFSGKISSPAIIKNGSYYYMWYVESSGCTVSSTTVKYRVSTDGVNWSSAQDVNISQPGYIVWHLDVIYVPSKNEYWMLFPAFPSGSSCGNTVLFYAKSADRINWTTYNKIALDKGSGWDSTQIYRSTLLYDSANDLLKVWYSARGSSGWRVGYTERNYNDFLTNLKTIDKWKGDLTFGTVDNGILIYNGSGAWHRSYSKDSYSPPMAWRARVYYEGDDLYTGFRREADSCGRSTFTNRQFYSYDDDGNYEFTSGVYGYGSWYVMDILQLSGTKIQAIVDGNVKATHTSHVGTIPVNVVVGSKEGNIKVDWILVRKYADPEPLVSIGSENVRITFSSYPEDATIEVIK